MIFKPAHIFIKPLITEKSQKLQSTGVYVFKIQKKVTRQQIKVAVENFFEVKVERVRTLTMKGKRKKFKQKPGKLSDWKKAFVTLAKNESIDYSKYVTQDN